ncbi:hypothetical protein BXY85_3059 [Roseivirga pacifica]|uniref:Uncharacterized protein n=1 Tax=Roseivirga pacifica TaxID=1267423 RepID=A0A1I0QWX3_9BACT|nr:hypothetical protein [Roseivirga pacifica]RKQ42449.1 hypothetical protein BXY85_3059 [Roseivirga pacifica]SEW32027.1 hypothetical protein SAMN05216290_2813 [Roseivirga pacifica]
MTTNSALNNLKENKKGKRFLLGVICLFVVFYVGNKLIYRLPLNYTIGWVTEYYKPSRSGRQAIFEYSVGNTDFQGSISLSSFKEKPELGDSFYVAFPKIFKGRLGKLLPDHRILDNINSIPINGWNEMPK